MFQKPEKAQELFDYIGESKFKAKFGNEIDNATDFIEHIVSDLTNNSLYGFVKVK